MPRLNKQAVILIVSSAVLGLFSLALCIPLAIGLKIFDRPEPGQVQLTRYARRTTEPAWSPDGRFIVFESQVEDPNPERHAAHKSELFIIGVDGQGRKRITYSQREPGHPAWSPDGQYIAFGDGAHVCLMRPDGSNLYCADAPQAARLAWAPDGASLAYDAQDQIYRLPVDIALGRPLPPAMPVHAGAYPVWSPDGQCLAYTSGIARGDVWVMRADGSDPKRLFAPERDTYPFGWSPDGQFLFINRYPQGGGDSQFIAVNLTDGQEFRLTSNQEYHSSPALSWDGKRIAFHSLRDDGYNLYLMDVRGLPAPKLQDSRRDCMPKMAGK